MSSGDPGWLSLLSVWLLILAQAMISRFLGSSHQWGLGSVPSQLMLSLPKINELKKQKQKKKFWAMDLLSRKKYHRWAKIKILSKISEADRLLGASSFPVNYVRNPWYSFKLHNSSTSVILSNGCICWFLWKFHAHSQFYL